MEANMITRHIPSLLSAAFLLASAFGVTPALSQGREVNCDRVPNHPWCTQQAVPAHSGTATVPGQSPITPVDAQTLSEAHIKAGDPVPAHGATATIPGASPITPVGQRN
jgi:hypothetical protein